MENSPKTQGSHERAADLRPKHSMVNCCTGPHGEEPNQQGSTLRPEFQHSGNPSNSEIYDKLFQLFPLQTAQKPQFSLKKHVKM